MAPRVGDVRPPTLPKFTPVGTVTPQAALFDGGPFRPGEIVMHALGATVNVVACVLAISSVVPVALSLWHVPVLLAGALVGWFVADLVSGVLHWAFDTWFDERVPPVRRMVLIVREHHVYPQQIFKYRWTQEVGIMSWFGALVVGAGTGIAAVLPDGRFGGPAVVTAAVVASAGIVLSLEVHKLGHVFDPGPGLRLAQRCGLVLSPRHHMRHHTGEHDEHYCIVNGWADRTLGRLGLFRMLETAVRRVTPADPPRTDDRGWRRAFGRPVAENRPVPENPRVAE